MDRAPVVTAPAPATVVMGTPLTLNVTAADPDGDPIAGLTADVSALPSGSTATFTPNATKTAATLTWTPVASDTGGPYTVTFTASNAMTGSASAAVTVVAPNPPPVPALALTPTTIAPPMMVTADASASTDPNGTVASYRFDFGDGTVVGPQSSPIANHTYTVQGDYRVTLTATDNGGATATASDSVHANYTNLNPNPGFESSTTGWAAYGSSTISKVTGGRSGTSALQVTKSSGAGWGVNDNPDIVAAVAGAFRTYRYSAWVKSVANKGQAWLRVQEFLGSTQKGGNMDSPMITVGPNWQLLTVDYTVTTPGTRLDMKVLYNAVGSSEKFLIDDVSVVLLPPGDLPPVLTAPVSTAAIKNQLVTVNVSVMDPDGQPVDSLTADLSRLPAGSNAHFTVNATHTAGTLTWTPTVVDVRSTPYVVTFTAGNVKVASTSTAITVLDNVTIGVNMCGNPGFEADLTGWTHYSGATLTQVAGGHTGSFAMECASPTVLSTFGCDDLPNWVSTVAGVGAVYHFSAWVKSAADTGLVKLRVKEYLLGTQVSTTVNSRIAKLTKSWVQLTADYTVTTAGSSLSFLVTDEPAVIGEKFLVDDVSISLVSLPAAPAASATPSTPLDAGTRPTNGVRAFASGDATLDLGAESQPLTVRVEGVDEAIERWVPTVTMTYAGRQIEAVPALTRLGVDADGNGRDEVAATFAGDDLARLLGDLADQGGRANVVVEVRSGDLVSRASLAVTVAHRETRFMAQFGPNPMRGEGTLALAITRTGPVHAVLYDVSGRAVRTLMNEARVQPGRYRLKVDGRGDDGARLASGVYFYRVEAAEGRLSGRVVVAR